MTTWGKTTQNLHSFILHSEQKNWNILTRPVQAVGLRFLQCSAVPWRHRDCKFPCYKTGTCDVQITITGLFPVYSTTYKNQDRSLSSFFFFLNNRIQERTYSLWAHLWKNRADYLNPLFRADHSQTRGTLHLATTPCNFMYKYVNF